MIRLPLCLLLLYNLLGYGAGLGMLGKADFFFKSVTDCDPPAGDVKFAVQQRKFNRTISILELTLSTPFDIGDDFMIEMKGAVEKEGGYKPGGLYLKETACKGLQLLMGEMFTLLLNAAGVEECPLPAGDHVVKDFYFDNAKFTTPQVYGNYRTEVLLFKDVNDLRLCTLLYYELVPKS